MEKQREKLILDLQRIQENHYQLYENENAWNYSQLMLQYVGDTDLEVRDDLIYATFCRWICEKEYFSNEELIQLLDVLLDENHLFFSIGNDGDNTVFTRTFSVLIIVLLLWKNRERSFLEIDKFIRTKDCIIKYYNEEKDLRGYLDNTGWAHGAAHGADAMCELVLSKESDEAILLDILKALEHILCNGKYFLSNEEDERMTRVVFIIFMKELLPKHKISDWIESLTKCISEEYKRDQYISQVNTKNFVRCLYFSLIHQQNTKDITDIIVKVEEKLNQYLQVDKELIGQ